MFQFFYNNRQSKPLGSMLIFPGIFLIVFGLLILFMPQLLVVMISGASIGLGAMLLISGINGNKSIKKGTFYRSNESSEWEVL